MFFLSGAASSVLDFLGSLQGPSSTQKNSVASAAASSQSPFNIPLSTTADSGTPADAAASAAPTSNMGAETMNALLSAQSQSATGAIGGSAAGSNMLGDIEQLLNQIGAGQGTTDSDGSSAAQGTGRAHHHHAGGIEQLLQALDSQPGTDLGTANTDGSTGSLDAMNSAVTAPGTGFPFSTPFSSPSDGTGTTASGLGAVNPLERLINLQARMFGAATAGGNLSTTA